MSFTATMAESGSANAIGSITGDSFFSWESTLVRWTPEWKSELLFQELRGSLLWKPWDHRNPRGRQHWPGEGPLQKKYKYLFAKTHRWRAIAKGSPSPTSSQNGLATMSRTLLWMEFMTEGNTWHGVESLSRRWENQTFGLRTHFYFILKIQGKGIF